MKMNYSGFMRVKVVIIWLALSIVAFSANAQSVGLVLSGGGAKGLSHVGVLKALEENNIPIDYICGTSMGAIVGGLYAIGLTPDEMIELFKSQEFESWYKGQPEQAYATYFYRDEPNAGMFSFSLSRKVDENEEVNPFDPYAKKKHKLQVDMPTSLVQPYPMDLAIIEIFAPSSVAAGEDFDNLMVPFFCVAADITNKEPYILKNGNLGAAVRASMTYPLYFKPIVIDSTLLFDGGFYNNFPWDVMIDEHNPDFIIGSKCVSGDMTLKEDDVISQVENMVMAKTDYDIPQEKGIVIGRKYPYGIMDFHKVDDIVEMGYQNALPYIKEIKERVARECTAEELELKREAFKTKKKPLKFHSKIEIDGELTDKQKSFITNTIHDKEVSDFDYEKLKRGYYRIIASDFMKTFYPSYKVLDDSLLTLKLRTAKSSSWNVSIGGNISSSSLNQGFLGVSYSHFGKNPWKIGAGVNMGKFYKGGYLSWRHDIGVRPLAYYSADFVAHQYDYYNGNQNLFAADKVPVNVQQLEYFGKLNFATPLAINRNILLKASFVAGQEYYKYYQNNNYTSLDFSDRSVITFVSPMIGIERNTQNYGMFPSEGKKEHLMLGYNYSLESYEPGTATPDGTEYEDIEHNKLIARVHSEAYFKVARWLNLGYLAELTVSTKKGYLNYISTMLATPAFKPIPHNNTLLMENYRASSYLGVGISPVFLFTKTLYLHTNVSWFQPYKYVLRNGINGYAYSEKFPRGSFMANAALVWQSPIGPISLSTTYYEKGEYNWYPQFNIGFLIFKKGAFDF